MAYAVRWIVCDDEIYWIDLTIGKPLLMDYECCVIEMLYEPTAGILKLLLKILLEFSWCFMEKGVMVFYEEIIKKGVGIIALVYAFVLDILVLASLAIVAVLRRL